MSLAYTDQACTASLAELQLRRLTAFSSAGETSLNARANIALCMLLGFVKAENMSQSMRTQPEGCVASMHVSTNRLHARRTSLALHPIDKPYSSCIMACAPGGEHLCSLLKLRLHLHSIIDPVLSIHTIMSADTASLSNEQLELIQVLSAGRSVGYRQIVAFVQEVPWHMNKTVVDRSTGDTGTTCLHWACETFAITTVEWLLKHGANCGLEDRYGYTPWDLVLERYMKRAVAYRFELEPLTGEWSLIKPFLEHEKRQMGGPSKEVVAVFPDFSRHEGNASSIQSCAWSGWDQWYSVEDLSVSFALSACGTGVAKILRAASTCACKHRLCFSQSGLH